MRCESNHVDRGLLALIKIWATPQLSNDQDVRPGANAARALEMLKIPKIAKLLYPRDILSQDLQLT